jgi:hypothetical protein
MCEPAEARVPEIEATARPYGRGQDSSGGDVVAYQQHHSQQGVGSWSRTRWIVLAAVVLAVAVAVILALTYSGGGGGAGY